MKSLECSSRLCTEFLARFLQFSEPTILSWVRATTADNYSIDKIKELEIPLLPLDEQRRIATILDVADNLRRKRRQASALLEGLPQAIFTEMFGDPATPTSDYSRLPLVQVARLINGDRSSNYPSGDDLIEDGIPFLSTKNIDGPDIDVSSCNYITAEKFHSLSQGKLHRHDLVITLRGTIGQCAEFDCSYDTGFINAQMMIIRPGTRIQSKYLREFIMHPRTQALLKRDSSGSAVPQLTGKQIGELLIPLPCRKEQELFSTKLSAVRKTFGDSVRHLTKLDTLFASLQHRVFNGELSSKRAERELEMAG
jgi:type I restriction enzyme, S subunit